MWFDVNERRNLADDPRHAATLCDLRSRLDGWMKCTDDALGRGPMVPPLGALLNDIEATFSYQVKEHLSFP